MRPFSILAILFLLVPVIELYLLIQVGTAIGALPTIGLVIFTAVLGAGLLRMQGLATLARFQSSMQRHELPAFEILEGVALLLGGALLLTPGFFTDAIGFLCLLPLTRQAIVRAILPRMIITSPASGAVDPFSRGNRDEKDYGRVIEGEYIRKQDD